MPVSLSTILTISPAFCFRVVSSFSLPYCLVCSKDLLASLNLSGACFTLTSLTCNQLILSICSQCQSSYYFPGFQFPILSGYSSPSKHFSFFLRFDLASIAKDDLTPHILLVHQVALHWTWPQILRRDAGMKSRICAEDYPLQCSDSTHFHCTLKNKVTEIFKDVLS